MSQTTTMFSLSPQVMIPDLLTRYPEARPVLDRYGLRGCGGEHGPHESLQFFARTHGVDERILMDELRQAIVNSPRHPSARALPQAMTAPRMIDSIYRPYFLGGIAVILTAGAVWGAWMLWKIGIGGDFHTVSIHEVNAHGHAQVFGWVGLFIMGFALQALPRMWQVELPAPRLATASLVAMLLGISVCTVAMASTGRAWAAPTALAAGLVELVAITAVVVMLATAFYRSSRRLEPYVAFLLTGLGWFIIQAGWSTWLNWQLMNAATPEQLLWYVSTYQAPLRDLQIHGLALFMILGVSIRMFPPMFGVPMISSARAWTGYSLLLVAVISEVSLFISYRWTHHYGLAASLLVPWLMLLAGVLIIALPWKLWRPLPTLDRSAKFIRIAYGWLLISLIMLLLLPIYHYVSGQAFSHAYYGAIRHGITVGFISMMIMGIAAKVVPTLRGRDPRNLPSLWVPFVLVNLGCFLRVSTQTLTDWHPLFFGIIGLSGTLEVAGLVIWGLHLSKLMVAKAPEDTTVDAPGSKPKPQLIAADHIVADVLSWYPQTMSVFEQFGFTMLRNPVMRRTMATRVTLGQVAQMRGIPIASFLEAMNGVIVHTENETADKVLHYDISLGELINAMPQAATVLERHGLDAAAQTDFSLGQAADRAGVSRETLLAELRRQ